MTARLKGFFPTVLHNFSMDSLSNFSTFDDTNSDFALMVLKRKNDDQVKLSIALFGSDV